MITDQQKTARTEQKLRLKSSLVPLGIKLAGVGLSRVVGVRLSSMIQ